MRSIWAVARQTLAQCLRMKVAGVFIVLLAVVVTALPFTLKGDGTLAGQIRTFLSYSVSMTTVLLTIVTIFLSVGVVSSDVQDKQVFLLAVKPLGRGEYVLGRWLGVVVFDAILILASGAIIYGLAQHLRGGKVMNDNDRRAVEMEIFSSRAKVRPDSIEGDIEKNILDRIGRLKQEGRYDASLDAYKERTGGDRQAAEVMLLDEIRQQVTEDLQSVKPGESMTLVFSGIRPQGGEVHGKGTVGQVVEDNANKLVYFEMSTSRRFLGQLIAGYPLRIADRDAWVSELRRETFVGVMHADDAERITLKTGEEMQLTAEPVIQISYQLKPSQTPPNERQLYGEWEVAGGDITKKNENTESSERYLPLPRRDPIRVQTTLIASARVVGKDGKISVTYTNRPDPQTGFVTAVTLDRNDAAVLYRIGSFEMNFVHGLMLILFQMMFMAAVGVMAGTFLSFAVGCILSFAVLPFSLARAFLSDAVRLSESRENDVWTVGGHYIYKVMAAVLPDLGSISVSDFLVDGVAISWSLVGTSALWTIGVRTALVLVVACLIFYRRELARVQV